VAAVDPEKDIEPQTNAEHQARTGASDRSRSQAAIVVSLIEAAEQAIRRSEDELGKLDAIAGDGDHGRGMVRGVGAATEAARTALADGAGTREVLVRAGQAWAGRAGGTSGVLWGAMLEAAGNTIGDDEDFWRRWEEDPTAVVAHAVEAAVAAVRALGKAELGDKTLLDALAPLQDSLHRSGGQRPVEAWTIAAAAATKAAKDTAALRPRLGRARPLAEQSVGHPDPGAVSLALI